MKSSKLVIYISFIKFYLVFLILYIMMISTKSTFAQHNLRWQVLGDVNSYYKHLEGSHPSFRLGALDLMFQTKVSDQWQALGELILMNMANSGSPQYHIHPARIYVEYQKNAAFRIRFGQIHTPIGLYSQLYPHGGKIFEMTVHRPKLAVVEHGKELLALHSIGFMLNGVFSLSSFIDVQYMMGIGNGGIHSGIDDNFWKSPYLNLRIFPTNIDGLSFGTSVYYDIFNRSHSNIYEDLHELIVNSYIHYDAFPFDILAEVFWLNHKFESHSPVGEEELHTQESDEAKLLIGGYIQGSYSFGDHAPYMMVEYFKRDPHDILLNEHTPYDQYISAQIGHRYYFSTHIILKSGYQYEWFDRIHRFDLQLAFQLM